MGTAAAMLAEARKSLGMGEPNAIQSWYRSRNGSDYSGNFAWCDAAVTFWARHSDNANAVLPNGDRAYTVYHATDFQEAGRWFSGTVENLNKAKPGDVVFFDWGASNDIDAIDHVGLIEEVLGDGRVQTIEGNTSDACLRRVRSASVIAGYGRPAYSATQSQEDDVISAEDIEKIAAAAASAVWKRDGIIDAPPNAAAAGNKFWTGGSYAHWGYRQGSAILSLVTELAQQSPDVDEAAIVQGVLAGLAPEQLAEHIAAALGPEVAGAVLDALRARLEA